MRELRRLESVVPRFLKALYRDSLRLAFWRVAVGVHFVEIVSVEVVEELGFVWRITCEAAGGRGKKCDQH